MAFRSGGPRPYGRAIKGHVFLDEKTERRLRRLRWRRIGIALGVITLIAGVITLYESPLLRVQNVEVVGTAAVSPQQVEQLAGLDSKSLFRLDFSAARERIQYLPMVKSVQIERHWPQTIRIQVTERAPWGFWQAGQDRYVIDDEGIVLQDAQPPAGAPVIRDLGNPVRLVPGDHVDADAVALTRSLVEVLPQKLDLHIASLDFSPATGLVLTTDAGYRVVIGDSQNMEYKLAVWREIEDQLGRDTMAGHVLDLRFGDRPSFQ